MDILFYKVELDNGSKIAHIQAELADGFAIVEGDPDYHLCEFTFQYFTVSEVASLKENLMESIYSNGSSVYIKDMTQEAAVYCKQHYYDGQSGIELSIFDFRESTPEGAYWCNI